MNQTFPDIQTLEREIVERSVLIKNMISDLGDEPLADAIPIPNVCLCFTLLSLQELTKSTG